MNRMVDTVRFTTAFMRCTFSMNRYTVQSKVLYIITPALGPAFLFEPITK